MLGAVVPDRVIRRLEQARDPELAGVRLAAELVGKARDIPGVCGVNILPLGDPGRVIDVLDRTA
jgi:hypothetical protein